MSAMAEEETVATIGRPAASGTFLLFAKFRFMVAQLFVERSPIPYPSNDKAINTSPAA